MSHTPGPWVIYRNRKGHVSKIEGSGGRRICTFQPSDQFVEGNSQIIVTALEMRDEIDQLKKEKADMLAMLEEIRECAYRWSEIRTVEQLDKVIRKARGIE